MLTLKQEFYFLISKQKSLCKLFRTLEQGNNLYLFGGAVRNYVENRYSFNSHHLPRDFDFVIEHKKGKTLDTVMQSLAIHNAVRRNGFGGYKLNFGAFSVDMWKMEETWAFTHTSLKESKDNLPKSVFLNIDGIVYDFQENLYYREIYDSAIESKEIEIVLKENPKIPLNLLRAIIFSKKYKMNLSNQIKTIIKNSNRTEENFAEQLFCLQQGRYRKTELPLAEIKKLVNSL